MVGGSGGDADGGGGGEADSGGKRTYLCLSEVKLMVVDVESKNAGIMECNADGVGCWRHTGN